MKRPIKQLLDNVPTNISWKKTTYEEQLEQYCDELEKAFKMACGILSENLGCTSESWKEDILKEVKNEKF